MRIPYDLIVKYSSPAMPPFKIDINKKYTIKYLKDNYGLNDNLLKKLFSPVDGSWKDLEQKKDKKNKKAENKEEIDIIIDEVDDGAED